MSSVTSTSELDRRVFSRSDLLVGRLLAKRKSHMPLADGREQKEYFLKYQEPKSFPAWIPAEFLSASLIKSMDVNLPEFSSESEESSDEENSNANTNGSRSDQSDDDQSPVIIRRRRKSSTKKRNQNFLRGVTLSGPSDAGTESSDDSSSSDKSSADSEDDRSSTQETPNSSKPKANCEEDVDMAGTSDTDSVADFVVDDSDDEIERRSWTPDKEMLEGFPAAPVDTVFLNVKVHSPTKTVAGKRMV